MKRYLPHALAAAGAILMVVGIAPRMVDAPDRPPPRADTPRIEAPPPPASEPPPGTMTLEQAAYAASIRVIALDPPQRSAPLSLFAGSTALPFAGGLSEGRAVPTPPWFVQIAIASPGAPGSRWEGQTLTEHCGGTLVAPRLVLTVAHCLAGRDGVQVSASEIVLRIAPDTRDDPAARLYRATVIGVHADFEGTTTNYRDDLALVLLPADAPGAHVLPESAWAEFDPPQVGDVVCPLGMGLDRADNLLSELHLKRLKIERVGTGTIGLAPAFGEAFRPGDSGGPSVRCDAEGRIADPLRLTGLVSSFSGEDRAYAATITNAMRAYHWHRLAGPALLRIGAAL